MKQYVSKHAHKKFSRSNEGSGEASPEEKGVMGVWKWAPPRWSPWWVNHICGSLTSLLTHSGVCFLPCPKPSRRCTMVISPIKSFSPVSPSFHSEIRNDNIPNNTTTFRFFAYTPFSNVATAKKWNGKKFFNIANCENISQCRWSRDQQMKQPSR